MKAAPNHGVMTTAFRVMRESSGSVFECCVLKGEFHLPSFSSFMRLKYRDATLSIASGVTKEKEP